MGMSSMPHRISNRVCAALLSGSAVWIQPRSVEAKKVIYITQLIYTLGGMSLVSLQVLEDRCLQLSTPPSHGALIGPLVSNLDKKGQGLNETEWHSLWPTQEPQSTGQTGLTAEQCFLFPVPHCVDWRGNSEYQTAACYLSRALKTFWKEKDFKGDFQKLLLAWSSAWHVST